MYDGKVNLGNKKIGRFSQGYQTTLLDSLSREGRTEVDCYCSRSSAGKGEVEKECFHRLTMEGEQGAWGGTDG